MATHRSDCARAFFFIFLALDPLRFLHLFDPEPDPRFFSFFSFSSATLARPVSFLPFLLILHLRRCFSSLNLATSAERNGTHADTASAQPHRFLPPPPPALFDSPRSSSSSDPLFLVSMYEFRVVREVFIIGRRRRGRRFLRFVRHRRCRRGAGGASTGTGSSEWQRRRSQVFFFSCSHFESVFCRGEGGGSGRDKVEIDGDGGDGFQGEEGREEEEERDPGVSVHECSV